MKRFIITALFGLGFSSGLWAAPQQIWVNYGTITNPAVIEPAVSFVNYGTIDLNTAQDYNNNRNTTGYDSDPFSVSGTSNYTNSSSGVMVNTPGFLFDTVTASAVQNAASFVNDGSITGLDFPVNIDLYSIPGSGTEVPIVANNQPIAGQVEVQATNIYNDGTMAVGNYGLLQLKGSNVTTVNGALVAGGLDTLTPDPIDTTGGGQNSSFYQTGFDFYINPAGVYDLLWDITNAGTLALDQISLTQVFPPGVPLIGNNAEGSRPKINGFGVTYSSDYQSYVDTYDTDASNTYFNIVWVNTNFFDANGQQDTNITVNVGFGGWEVISIPGIDVNAESAMIQFAEAVPDVITAQIETNTVYLLDDGAVYPPGSVMTEYNNAGSADGYYRPSPFALTTTTPDLWPGSPANTNYDPNIIYEADTYIAKDVPYNAAEYIGQIGRNPSQVDGNFDFENESTVELVDGVTITNFVPRDLQVDGSITLPDPTNEPGRIELTGNQVDIFNSRIRADGLVTINATNFMGQAAGTDWGEINAQLGSTNGSLSVSNVFPMNFQRLRGDIYAWSGTWVNTHTNGYTNTFHYHLLIVAQDLGGNFRSAIRNLSFTGTNGVNVQDPLYVINQSYFNTTSLTLNSNAVFTQNAGNLTPTNMPKLKYFLNNTNGNLMVDNLLDFGYDVTKTPVAPTGRKYSVLAVTNFGQMTATEPLFQSELFENDGSIVADSNGSIIIEAASLGMGLALTNATNALIADGNVTLSAVAMGIVNSVITNGANGNPGLLTLQSTLNGEITDFTSSAPSTNTPLVNFWEVTDGFSLPVKPATGDLFGTKITTTTTNFTVAVHTWAGVDLGATSEGFSDNMVIGHLKLSRMSANSVLRFTGAGVQNAMYVDYLELDPNSLSYGDYRDGLIIDPNLTIYFAGCNVDPLKLETVYTNRLVWVPSFAGPNSTVAVPIYGTTNFCLMNSNVAFSQDISSSDSGIPNFNNQPYVLHNPITGSDAPCPGAVTTFKDFIVENGISITNGMTLQIAASGAGVVKPNLKQSQIALGKTYSLTATPSNGWVFSGWSTAGLPAGMSTTSRTLKFQLNNTVSVTAIFTPKAFTLTKGTYHGLFMDPSVIPTPANSGSFTLAVNSGGEFSGRLLMGPTNYTFSDKFPTNGIVQVSAKHGSQSQLMELQLDTTGQTGQVTGYVGTPAVHLLGDLAPVWTAHDPSPYFGQYTIALTNGGTNAAKYGDSYGTLTVSKQGILSVGGVLADGASFSQSVPVSKNGMWPFYTYVPASRDRLLGWVSFQGTDLLGATLGQTNVFWTKGPSRGRYYPEGFSDTFNLVGSPYSNPGKNASGLTLVDPVAVLTGGGLAAPAMLSLTYDGKLTYATNDFNLTIKPTQGIISGRLETSGGDPVIKLQGVVLQNQNAAFGFFLGTNDESGAVLLESQ